MTEVPPQSIRELHADLEFAVRKYIDRGKYPRIEEALARIDAKRAASKRHPGYREDDQTAPMPMPRRPEQLVKVVQEEIKW